MEPAKPTGPTPVNINLTTGRRTRSKPLSIKPEVITDGLSIGFAHLENRRGPHWKRTKTEIEPFSKALSAVIPDLPPEALKTIEKVAPWASLALTGAFLFLPGILAEVNIASAKEELKRRARTQPNPAQPANASQQPANPGTIGGNLATPPSGARTGENSGGVVPPDGSTTPANSPSVPAFGRFGNLAE